MSADDLSPDPESLEKWQNLPQNEPSVEALPPASGGFGIFQRWMWLFIIIAVLIVLGLLSRGLG